MSSGLKSALSSYASATKKVRQTVNAVIDENSFVELDAFMGGVNELGQIRGEGVYCGLASVDDRDVAVVAMNPEVFSGGISKRGAEKIVRLVKRACDASLPLLTFIDSAGARVLEGVDALYGYDLILNAYSKAYGNIPVITAVTGKCFGMTAYLAGLSDMFVCVEKAKISTSSPLILTGDDTKDCSGAKNHYKTSGAVTNLVKDETELRGIIMTALEDLCDVVSYSEDDPNRVCEKLSARSSVKDVLAEAFDAGSVLELRGGIANEVTTAFAKLNGITVAVVGVDGRLSAKGAAKITDFINTADNAGIPVVNLVNSTGIIIDAGQENCCLIRNVSDMIYAYNNISVPKIALICGKAIGAAYSVLASKTSCDYTVAWDVAVISPMEKDSAAYMLYGKDIARAKDPAAAERKFAAKYSGENSAMTAAEKGYVDTVIVPNHSRQYLIAALQTMVKR